MKEKWDMWVPLKKKKEQEEEEEADHRTACEEVRFIYLFIFSSLNLFLINMVFRPSEFIGPRTKSALLDEGYT